MFIIWGFYTQNVFKGLLCFSTHLTKYLPTHLYIGNAVDFLEGRNTLDKVLAI
jgi:hypothetical protein